MKKRRNIPASKFALGTANFNMRYGLNNKKKFLRKKTVFKILKILRKNKIFYLDTARTYNNAEKVLGNFDKYSYIVNNFRERFKKEYTLENLCLHWYNIFRDLDNIKEENV